MSSGRNPLQPLSKHHFNLKHSLGMANCHLSHCGTHKHAFMNPSPLTFPLFICLPLSFLLSAPISSSFFIPCAFPHHLAHFPFCYFPLLFLSWGLHYLLTWTHLRQSLHASTSGLLRNPGTEGINEEEKKEVGTAWGELFNGEKFLSHMAKLVISVKMKNKIK